jgi:hypothetical protein
MNNSKKPISIGDLFLDKSDNSLCVVISEDSDPDYFVVYWFNCPIFNGRSPKSGETISYLRSLKFVG